MAYRARISLATYEALTDTNPDHFALFADQDNVLIKEKARGTITLGYTASQAIAHGLSYIPMALVWGDDVNGNLILAFLSNPVSFSNMWLVSIDTTNLNITQGVDNNNRVAQYYLFYDFISSGTPSFTHTGEQLAISKSGVNVLTDTNPNDYIFHSNLNTFKIIATGTVLINSINGIATATINHNLGTKSGFYLYFSDPHFSGLVQAHNNQNADYKVNGDGTLGYNTYQYSVTGYNTANILTIQYQDAVVGFSTTVRYYIFEVAQ